MSQVVIGDILPYTQAIATGGQTVFGTNWTADVASDVVVYQTPSGDDADDVTQILAYPADYSVAFIGSQQDVQVTLVTPAGAGDRITITRNTPADRENLYTNTNFLPSMLNNDFGILTLVDQQAQLVDQKIGPRYNYSAVIVDVVDTILPILGANQVWVKNNANTAIIPLDVPTSGFAPQGATYVTTTDETSLLPNSVNFAGQASGLTIFNSASTGSFITRLLAGTTNQTAISNPDGIAGNPTVAIANNPIIPGTAGMGVPQGTTGQRVIPVTGINFRFNTTNAQLEYWDGAWVGLTDNGLTHNQIFVGDASNTANDVPMSGDATIIDTGAVTVSSIGGVPIVLGGAFTTIGAFTVDFTFTGNTAVTFPTSGTLATTTSSLVTLTGDTGTATVSSGNINVVGGTTGLTFTGATDTLTLGGILDVDAGGTGLNSLTIHNLIIGNDANDVTLLPPHATPGIPLISMGVGADPAYGTAVVAGGGTGVTSVTTVPTATAFAGWDANKNMSADNFLGGYSTTATAAGNTTLTADSSYWQFFTGVTTQTVTLPVASTLVLGQTYFIVNLSSGAVTVNSSGGNAVQVMAANTSAIVTCILTSGTSAASWSVIYYFNGGGSGTVAASTANYLAYYAATGNTVSGLTTVNSAFLTTSAAGVPTWNTSQPFNSINIQRVTAAGAGTYTPTSGMKFVIVKAQAAGSGGGGVVSASAAQFALGAGGSGGEFISALFTAAQIGASKGYVVGAGGAGGAAGNNTGAAGGDTTFNTTWIVAKGGNISAGGGTAVGNQFFQTPTNPGAGGSVATGTLIDQFTGGYSGVAYAITAQAQMSNGGEAGGGGPKQAINNVLTSTSQAGSNGYPGGGGSGAGSYNGGSAAAGGNGGDGWIEFIEYIFA